MYWQVQGKAIWEQVIYCDFLCIFQAFHAVTAWRCLSSSITASGCLFGNLLVFNFKIIKISICQKIDKLILHKKVKILFYYLLFILTKIYIYIFFNYNIVVLINKKLEVFNNFELFKLKRKKYIFLIKTFILYLYIFCFNKKKYVFY